MSANAIDNSNLKNYRDDAGTTGFVPTVSYVYNAVDKEIDLTHTSDFPSGTALKKVQIQVHDKFGKQVNGSITPPVDSGDDAETTIDVSTLDNSKGLDIKATVISDDGGGVGLNMVADGSAYNIQAAGNLGSWDIQKNASFPVA